jgi:hypothetical protein
MPEKTRKCVETIEKERWTKWTLDVAICTQILQESPTPSTVHLQSWQGLESHFSHSQISFSVSIPGFPVAYNHYFRNFALSQNNLSCCCWWVNARASSSFVSRVLSFRMSTFLRDCRCGPSIMQTKFKNGLVANK